ALPPPSDEQAMTPQSGSQVLPLASPHDGSTWHIAHAQDSLSSDALGAAVKRSIPPQHLEGVSARNGAAKNDHADCCGVAVTPQTPPAQMGSTDFASTNTSNDVDHSLKPASNVGDSSVAARPHESLPLDVSIADHGSHTALSGTGSHRPSDYTAHMGSSD